MTPPASHMQFHLDQRCRWFHNEWFFKWHHIGSDSAVQIDTFDGREANFGGITYSGSVVQAFWDSVVRGVRKEISEQFAWLDDQVRRYNSDTAEKAVDECAGLLTSFAESMRRAAVEKDRVLRGKHGTPAALGADSGHWEGTTRSDIAARAKALKDALRPDSNPNTLSPSTGLDHVEKQIIAALVIDHHRPADRLLGHEEFAAEYFISASVQSINAIVADLGERGLVDVHRDKDSASAILRPSGVKRALQQVIADLGGNSFDVDAKKERVLSDAHPYVDFPLPKGWDFITFDAEQAGPDEPEGVRVDSTTWTGPHRSAVLTEDQRVRVLQAISDAERRLQGLKLDNSQRSQVLALLGAAKDLAEAPEPPADIIWQLVGRAADVLGIAAFFATILLAVG